MYIDFEHEAYPTSWFDEDFLLLSLVIKKHISGMRTDKGGTQKDVSTLV